LFAVNELDEIGKPAAGGSRHSHRAETLGHSDVSTIMIYMHVIKASTGGTASPLDVLLASPSYRYHFHSCLRTYPLGYKPC
jgi:hypothetical protein